MRHRGGIRERRAAWAIGAIFVSILLACMIPAAASAKTIPLNASVLWDPSTYVDGSGNTHCSEKWILIVDVPSDVVSYSAQAYQPSINMYFYRSGPPFDNPVTGYGPDYRYFTHRLGHGIGMDGHEWPYLVRGNTKKVEANITTSNEPGIYIRGEFGIRLEDDMHITENGAELFTPQSLSLEDPFGKP